MRTAKPAARPAAVATRSFLAAALAASFACGLATAADSKGPKLGSQLLEAAGVRGGLIVHVGCGDGELTAALRANDACVVHGLDREAASVAAARHRIDQLGCYGPVSVDHWCGEGLPYADNLAALLVLDRADALGADEMLRVVRPGGAVLIRQSAEETDRAGLLESAAREAGAAGLARVRLPSDSSNNPSTWIKIVKAYPQAIDQWTHFLHDASGNAVAADRRVAPATALQWVAGPKFCRSHEIDSSLPVMVSSGSRLVYILDEGPIGVTDPRFPAKWMLLCRDAFSGVLLWKRPLEPWGWQQWKPELREKDWRTIRGQRTRFPAEVPRRLVAVGDRIFVTLGFHDAPISIVDAATGDVLAECEGTEGTQEIVVQGDTIFARVRPTKADQAARRGSPLPTRLTALDAATGKQRWSQDVGRINPLSLAAAGEAVVFLRGGALVCCNRADGATRWESDCPGGKIVVIHDDVVLVTGKTGTYGFSIAEGKQLWKGPSTGRDLLVIDDMVWRVQHTTGILARREERWPTLSHHAGVRLHGHDVHKGQVRRTIDIPNAMSPGHHLRCYRSKATERFIIYPKRGAEFFDLHGDEHMRHDWLRGSCRFGVLPCNGLLYTPPDQCFCYAGAKMNGLVATSGADTSEPTDPRSPGRLEKGPAFASANHAAAEKRSAGRAAAAPADWPTFRADAKRSGSNRAANVPQELEKRWEAVLHTRLTQPTVAAGKVFVAAVDANTVHAFDAATGKPLWKFIAGGPVDSPPTYYQGLLLFGAADGRVYCLDAATGRLGWRFLAAPSERRIVAFGRVESPWPVHGTVLVKDSLAYVAAGRSTLVDGGAHFYALDPRSGKVIHHAHLEQPQPDLSEDIGEHFAMDGSNVDVLTTDGEHIFCMQEMFDGNLDRIETQWNTRHGDRFLGDDHLMATGGLLDESGFNRLFWTHGNRWPGFYFLLMAPKSGNLLVFDSEKTWATKWFVERNIHSPLFFPETTGYLLFCDENSTDPFLVGDEGAPEPIPWLPETLMKPYTYDGHSITNHHDNYSVEVDKGAGFTRGVPTVWQEYLPVRIEAMALAAEVLFAAGKPDVLDPDDPLAALEGRKGGALMSIDPASGERLWQAAIDSPPRFDGMAVAGEGLYLATEDGRLVCFAGK